MHYNYNYCELLLLLQLTTFTTATTTTDRYEYHHSQPIEDCRVSLEVTPVAENTKVQLAVKCRHLPRGIVHSKCDPVVVLFTSSLDDSDRTFGRKTFFSKTECVKSNTNPHFESRFCLEHPDKCGDTELTFSVYDQVTLP